MIDAQYVSSTEYVSTTMNGNATVFGVNFADGRIKGYPQLNKLYYVALVRGNTSHGVNSFVDNGDGTITDLATGLMWQKADSVVTYNWEQALDYAENLTLAGYSDWRLPNVKELQGIVDYTRSPATSGTPAIDPLFDSTARSPTRAVSSIMIPTGAGRPTSRTAVRVDGVPTSRSAGPWATGRTSGRTSTAPAPSVAIPRTEIPPTTQRVTARRATRFASSTTSAPCAVATDPCAPTSAPLRRHPRKARP